MSPIIWDSNPKFKIMDLHESHYDEVLTLIQHHYFVEEPMCKSIGLLHDPASVTTYSNLIKTWMKDTCSLVAVSAKSGRVVAVAVARINSSIERSNTYSRVQVYEGERLKAIMHLKSSLILQADAYQKFGHNTYLRIYVLCIHPSYKPRGVGNALLKAHSLLALNMQVPIVAGIFTSREQQQMALNNGYLSITEIFYKKWMIDDEVVFDDPGVGNLSAAFMYLTILDTKSNEDNIRKKRIS